jgi:hypothetical protein
MKLKVKLTFSKNDYVQSKNNYQGRSYSKMKCTQICLKVWWRVTNLPHLAEVALRQGVWGKWCKLLHSCNFLKSSLIHYTFDKIKFLSQLHICIILLYLIFYFSKFMFKSWLVAHENWVSVELEGVNYFHIQVIQSQPFLITAFRVASLILQTVLLKYILFLFLYINVLFKSWLVAHENWVSVESFLVPGNCKNAGFCTIYPTPPAVRTPLRGPSTRLLNRIEWIKLDLE